MKFLPAVVLAAVVAALASIAVPNLLTAKNRSAQKRTMADLRTVATAWEARATDFQTYAVGRKRDVKYDELQRALVPTYLKHLPAVDGWGHPLRFRAEGTNYSILAVGKDGRIDRIRHRGPTTDFATDIIYANGSFESYPEGV